MTTRSGAVRAAFLQWLDQHRREQPNHDEFLADAAASRVDGEQVTAGELDAAVPRLVDHGLIKGVPLGESEIPARLQLTAAGSDCVEDHAGDVEA